MLRILASLIWSLTIGVADVGHMLLSHTIDLQAMIFLVVAMVPWLGFTLKSADFDLIRGRLHIEAPEVIEAARKLLPITGGSAAALPAPESAKHQETEAEQAIELKHPQKLRTEDQLDLYEIDPNLALVKFRIEIERRLTLLAKIYDLYPSDSKTPMSASQLIRRLTDAEIFGRDFAEGLTRFVQLGNLAAHGAQVSTEAALAVQMVEPQILSVLDALIKGAQVPRNRK